MKLRRKKTPTLVEVWRDALCEIAHIAHDEDTCAEIALRALNAGCLACEASVFRACDSCEDGGGYPGGPSDG